MARMFPERLPQDVASDAERPARVRAILKPSFAFGGHNATLVLTSPEFL